MDWLPQLAWQEVRWDKEGGLCLYLPVSSGRYSTLSRSRGGLQVVTAAEGFVKYTLPL